MSVETNRRRADRINWNGNIEIADANTHNALIKGFRLQDINKKGFSFQSGNPLAIGGKYLFTIRLGKTDLNINGRVRHLSGQSPFFSGGVTFTDTSIVQRSRLNRFLSAKSKKFELESFFISVLTGFVAMGFAQFFGANLLVSALFLFLTPIAMFLWMPW